VRHEQNGLLFAAGSAASLRAAIERLATEAGLYERLRPAAPAGIAAGFDRFGRADGRR